MLKEKQYDNRRKDNPHRVLVGTDRGHARRGGVEMREETHEGTVMPLADNLSASLDDFTPRILVKYKYNNRYALWMYEPKDWDGSNPYYEDHWDIIAWAYTPEEREALNATVKYHTQLMKEIENANN